MIFSIASLIFSLFAVATFAQTESSLQQELTQIRDSNQVPALAALLYQNGNIKDMAAVGIRKLGNDTPVTVNDKFHLGSDTKAMTATLAAMFIDAGKLSWSSTLAELLPEITNMDAAYKTVTVEMLLAHRAGLTADVIGFNGGKLWRRLHDPNLKPTEGRNILAEEMLSQPPASQPGSKFEYTNADYTIIGYILEKISGHSWEHLLKRKLFEPLQMKSCGFGPLGNTYSKNPHQPWAHSQTKNGIRPVIADNPETIGPAGTVHCSMQDWSKFVALHMNAYNGKPALVSAESFLKLHTRYPDQEYTYGGWIRVEQGDRVVFTHDGSNNLNYATVVWAPQRQIIMIAASNIGGEAFGEKATHEALTQLLKEVNPR